MHYKKRLLEDKLQRVSGHFAAVVLTGARQGGKEHSFQASAA